MNLDRAREIADAVLMEGYALYPYRASAPKNRFRWTFGVLAPRAWSEAGGCEPWWLQAQVLIAGAPQRIVAQLRFFQIERRGALWDAGVLRTLEADFSNGPAEMPFGFPAVDPAAQPHGERCAISGRALLRCEVIPAEQPLMRVTIRVENRTPWSDLKAPRAEVIAAAFASTHVLLGAAGGTLLSAIDPPAWARSAAGTCKNLRVFPVLVGTPGIDDLVLAAPFIMNDHPVLAPESAGDLCDATEIDELLVLRTRTLTDDEKREARATDPRAAEIIDRAERLPDTVLDRMHGARRDLRAGEMVPRQVIPAVGSKVRLLAPTTRTDAQDLLYAGHVATVVELREDVDGTQFIGVTVDDDPAAELHQWYGRCHYYRPDEVEPL